MGSLGARQHTRGGSPHSHGGPGERRPRGAGGGRRGSRGGGQRGSARPEECGRPGSPGAAAASCASRPGPRRWVWESCRCALGQPPAASPRARRGTPRPPPPPPTAHIQAGLLFSPSEPRFGQKKRVCTPKLLVIQGTGDPASPASSAGEGGLWASPKPLCAPHPKGAKTSRVAKEQAWRKVAEPGMPAVWGGPQGGGWGAAATLPEQRLPGFSSPFLLLLPPL